MKKQTYLSTLDHITRRAISDMAKEPNEVITSDSIYLRYIDEIRTIISNMEDADYNLYLHRRGTVSYPSLTKVSEIIEDKNHLKISFK